ncbi:MAG: hypothetical protein KDA42_02030 [Planctomycetales bacterium]|nr:hypothetical protein [Planctomycetales bacterium]
MSDLPRHTTGISTAALQNDGWGRELALLAGSVGLGSLAVSLSGPRAEPVSRVSELATWKAELLAMSGEVAVWVDAFLPSDKSLALLLEAPTGVSVAVANQVAAEIADAGVRQNAVLEFAKRLGETDEAAAIEFAGQHGTQVELEESLAAIKLSQLARNKPLDALSAAAKLGGDVEMILAQVSYRLDGFEREVIDIVEPTPDAPHSEALSNLLRTWATRDPEAALAAVSDDRLKAYRGEIWSSAAGTQPLETIEAALEAGDANVAKVAIETGIIALAREDSATALAVFGTVIEDPVHTSLLSSRIVEKVASALVRDVSIQDALSWTTTLPERLSKPAMRSVFDTGMQQDFGVVSDLVHRLPPGAARNQGMLRIATATIEADPVFAFDTLLQVPEADREKRHFDQLFKFWREIDSGAANAAAASVGITR